MAPCCSNDPTKCYLYILGVNYALASVHMDRDASGGAVPLTPRIALVKKSFLMRVP